jgi:hypothetical protein
VILCRIKKLSDLKTEPSDWNILYAIATESGLYPLWLDDVHYEYLTNFMKYKFGILVREGYVFCKNDFACRIVTEFTSVSYKDVFVMKGLFE